MKIMKKILLFIFLVPIIANSQIKIGSITISDSLAKEYFFDCIKNPDTIYVDMTTENSRKYQSLMLYEVEPPECAARREESERESKEYEKKHPSKLLAKNDTILFISGGASWWCGRKGYAIPRKPSEEDFVKWYSNK